MFTILASRNLGVGAWGVPFSSACGGDRLTEKRHAGFDHTLREVRYLRRYCGAWSRAAVALVLRHVKVGMLPMYDGMYVLVLARRLCTWLSPSFSPHSLSSFAPCYFTHSKSLAPGCQIGRGFLARNRPVVCRISHSSVTSSVGTLLQPGYGPCLILAHRKEDRTTQLSGKREGRPQ